MRRSSGTGANVASAPGAAIGSVHVTVAGLVTDSVGMFIYGRDQLLWRPLGDGYRVEARFVLWQTAATLKVPEGAVFRHGDGFAVFRVQEGVARMNPVSIGHRGEAEVEIVSGLQAGTAIALHPGDRVRDGARVEAR